MGIVLIWEVLLVVCKEIIQLNALSEILVCLHASNVLEHVEVSVHIDASSDQSVPVNALQLDVCIVFLELEIDSFAEVNIRSLDSMHILPSHFELGEVIVLWKNLHIYLIIN